MPTLHVTRELAQFVHDTTPDADLRVKLEWLMQQEPMSATISHRTANDEYHLLLRKD